MTIGEAPTPPGNRRDPGAHRRLRRQPRRRAAAAGALPAAARVTDIIGLEASGVVAAVGEGVTRWNVGDEVVALLAGGGYAGYFVVHEGQAIAPPPGVDLVSAAGVLEVAATVASNVRVGFLKAGQVFLVHGGAGGIGTFATQYAKAIGAIVAATAGSPEKLDHCRSFGADFAFDYHGDWVSELKEATGGPT
nr:zinc-binding dehydrogenase [Tessaracoccus coleopterorum]